MRSRVLTALAGLALIATACGSSGEPEAAPLGAAGAPAAQLAYLYDPGEQLTYSFDAVMDVSMNIDASGGVPAEMSGPMVMGMDLSGIAGFGVAAGPEEGTTALTMRFEFADLNVRELTIGGQSVADQLPTDELASMFDAEGMFPEVTVIVDELGNVKSMQFDGEELPLDLFGGDLAQGNMFGGFAGPDMFLGPAFPVDQLDVGSEWETVDTQDIPMLGTMTSRATFRVVESRVKEGHDLFRIESKTTVEPMEVDFGSMMTEMAQDQAALDAMGMSAADLDMLMTMMPEFDMKMSITPEPVVATTWFDATAGVVVQSDADVRMKMDMSVGVPGEGNMSVDMDIAMKLRMEFLDRTRVAA